MTYLQYIFSDKKSAVYWISGFVLITILTTLRVLIKRDDFVYYEFWVYFNMYFYLIFFLIFYLGYYTSGYLKYKLQEKFKVFYKSKIEKNSIYEVEVYQDKVKINQLIQNNEAKLLIQTRKDHFQLCKTGDSIIILGQVYDFGIFRRHIRPLQIDLNNSQIERLRFTVKPVINNIELNNQDLVIKFKKSIYGINKLIIKDYNK